MKHSDDWIYDAEVLPNVFTIDAMSCGSGEVKQFEISPRKNDMKDIMAWINWLALKNCRMVGFNNIHYDYPIIHFLMTVLADDRNAKSITKNLKNKSDAIFKDSKNPNTKFKHNVWDNQHIVAQLDLLKIHHMDNKARMTSLKRLEFNMRMDSIQEFAVDFNEPVKKSSIIRDLIKYNAHDRNATKRFMDLSKPQIDFREKLEDQFGMSVMNDNDTKIGEKYLINRLKEEVGEHVLFTEGEDGKRKKLITKRDVMPVKELIFDYIKFERPEFQSVLDKMLGLKIFMVKGKFHWNEHDEYLMGLDEIERLKRKIKSLPKEEKPKFKEVLKRVSDKYNNHDISCEVNDFTFEFGKGGLHGTLRGVKHETTEERMILDIDAKGYYPDIGVKNNLYPEHLGPEFVKVYGSLPAMREMHAKGTPENGLFKLSSNGSYGKTNSIFSHLCDPKYMIQTTINGQLLLCMLWEQLMKVPGTIILQANTDGITIEIHKTKEHKAAILKVCKWWEKLTKLTLEYDVYSRMWIRDGNNYIAEYMNGKVKQKGAYMYQNLFHDKDMDTSNVEWHKNHSMMVVQKAVNAQLVDGISASKFIIEHDNIYDFFLCTNVNRSCKLHLGDGSLPAIKKNGEFVTYPRLGLINKEIQRNSRYIISNSQDVLTKEMKPLPNQKHVRYIGINVGYNVSVYNDVKSENVSDYDINYQFYINEAAKLLKPFGETP